MIEQDTIRLLRECDAGVKMGVSAIEETLPYVKDPELQKRLQKSLDENSTLKHELGEFLDVYHDDGKEPAIMAKGMSWCKTNVRLAVNASDETIADLITDGCNMGIKSLHKYINQYKAADRKSKQLADKLVGIEERLAYDMRAYL